MPPPAWGKEIYSEGGKQMSQIQKAKKVSHTPFDRKYYDHVLLSKRERRLFERWSQQNNLAYTEQLVFDLLMAHPEGLEPAQISAHTMIYKQTLTRVLRNLDEKGFISQSLNPLDHRKKIVSITEAGKDFIWNCELALIQAEWEAISFLSDEELEHFNETYRTIIRNLEEILFGSPVPEEEKEHEEMKNRTF